MKFTYYDPATGRILEHGEFPGLDYPRPGPNPHAVVIEGENYDHRGYYVDVQTKAVKPREMYPGFDIEGLPLVADGVSEVKLKNIPKHATIDIQGHVLGFQPNDTEFVFTTDTPGPVEMKIEAFPFVDVHLTFDAHNIGELAVGSTFVLEKEAPGLAVGKG